MPTRFDKESFFDAVECLRAFFLASEPWLVLFLRGFESPWTREAGADWVEVDEAVEAGLGGSVLPCRYVRTCVSESFRWGSRSASGRCFGSFGSRVSLDDMVPTVPV